MPKANSPTSTGTRFSGPQIEVIEAATREVWVSAAAGSGKTRCLVERLARAILEDPGAATRTLAFTFTRKAAQEMTSRLRETLLQSGKRESVRALDRLRIGTMDSFCMDALRAHAAELGLDPQFELLADVERSEVQSRAAARALERAAASQEDFAPWFLRYEARDLADLLVELGETLRSAGDPAELLGAWLEGEGKDFASYVADHDARRVRAQHELLELARPSLERGAAHPSRRPQDVDQMRQALERLAAGKWDPDAWKDARKALSAGVGKVALREGFKEAREPGYSITDNPFLKDARELPETLAEKELYEAIRTFVGLLQSYLKELREAKSRMVPERLDFQDVQLFVVKLAKQSALFREFAAREIQSLLVDEFQDTSGLQSTLVEVLGLGAPVFGVGDAMQSIYRFRHAQVELFDERLGREASPERTILHLSENWRSHPSIVTFINAVFPRMQAQAGAPKLFEALHPARTDSPAPSPRTQLLTVQRPEVGDPDPALLRVAEARLVARELLRLVEGDGGQVGSDGQRIEWKQVALLFRSRSALPTFARVFSEQGIPFESADRELLLESREAADGMALLQVLHNPLQDIPLAAVLRSPFVRLSDDSLHHLARLAWERRDGRRPLPLARALEPAMERLPAAEAERVAAFRRRLADSRRRVLTQGASGVLHAWIREAGYAAREGLQRDTESVCANLDAFLELLRSIEPARGDLQGVCERLRLLRETGEGPGEGGRGKGTGVQLLTIHKAKGLEFKVVVVPFLERDWRAARQRGAAISSRLEGPGRRLRLAAAMGASLGDDREWGSWADLLMQREELRDDRAEELRLLYVACTRAEEHLILSGVSEEELEFRRDGAGRWLSDSIREARQDGLNPDDWISIRQVALPAALGAEGQRRSAPLALGWKLALASGGAPPAEEPELMAAAEELVGSASRPMPEVHASPRDLPAGGLARALICPWRWRARAWLDELGGEAALGASEAGGEASERGDRVHGMFEAWDFKAPFTTAFDSLADRVAMPAEERELVKSWAAAPVIAASQPRRAICQYSSPMSGIPSHRPSWPKGPRSTSATSTMRLCSIFRPRCRARRR